MENVLLDVQTDTTEIPSPSNANNATQLVHYVRDQESTNVLLVMMDSYFTELPAKLDVLLESTSLKANVSAAAITAILATIQLIAQPAQLAHYY